MNAYNHAILSIGTQIIVNPNASNIIVELGQSNMEGQDGDTANPSYPFATTNGYFWDGSVETALDTTRGNAVGGSHATYFAEKYFSLSGNKPVMVEAAQSGSAMASGLNGFANWSASSSLRGNAKTLTDSALTNYGGTSPKAALWCQGESDGNALVDVAGYTRADAKSALQSIVDWWFGLYPDSVFIISQTGFRLNTSYDAAYTTIQEIQQEVVNENQKVYMAFTGAKDFRSASKMKDEYHYKYTGLKEMGESFAVELNNIYQ
jgi:hypothetical protein